MQPLYRQSQYRNSAVHQPGRAPQVTLPTPDFSASAKAAAAMTDHAEQLKNTVIEDIEYISSLAEEDRISELASGAIAEYTRRSNLPDGVDDSWYDERGIFRETEYKEWENSILSQFNTTSAEGFILPESKQKAVAVALDTRKKLRNQLTAHQAADIPAHARRRLDTSIRHHLERGDYLGATAILSTAPSKIINDEDRAALLHSINMDSNLSRARQAAASGTPADFISLIDDPSFLNSCDTPTRNKILALAADVAPSAPRAGLARSKDGTVSYREEFPNLPAGLPDYIYDPYMQSGGQPAFKSNPALRDEALKRLTRYAAEYIDPSDPQQKIRFQALMEYHGFDKGDANTILAPLEEAYNEALVYNPEKTSAQLVTWRNYATAAQRAELITLERNLAGLASEWDELPETASEDKRLELSLSISDAQAKINALANEIKVREKDAEAKALASFLVWKNANPNATKAEKITAYYDRLDDYTNVGYKALKPYQQEIQAVEAADDALARIRQDYGAVLSPDEAELNTAIVDASRSALSEAESEYPYTMECSSSSTAYLPGSAEEPILYIPADSPSTPATITVRNGKTTIPAKVVKTDKVATAMLSGYLRYQLGILGASGYNTINIRNGEATLTQTPQADTFSNSIFDLEARRDKNGDLIVYNPPKADGGGAYEIAGINAKHHPQKAARLKYLIESGNPEQAEKEAKEYYIHYTQPAGDTLTIQGVNSPAAELMLRDIYFNMGPRGMQRVLYRAFGNQPIANYLRFHNEQDLLQRIYTARSGYYEAIIRSNPSKKIFRNGWLNRNNKVLASATALIK